jgi:hypothetical protein
MLGRMDFVVQSNLTNNSFCREVDIDHDCFNADFRYRRETGI